MRFRLPGGKAKPPPAGMRGRDEEDAIINPGPPEVKEKEGVEFPAGPFLRRAVGVCHGRGAMLQ